MKTRWLQIVTRNYARVVYICSVYVQAKHMRNKKKFVFLAFTLATSSIIFFPFFIKFISATLTLRIGVFSWECFTLSRATWSDDWQLLWQTVKLSSRLLGMIRTRSMIRCNANIASFTYVGREGFDDKTELAELENERDSYDDRRSHTQKRHDSFLTSIPTRLRSCLRRFR